MNGVCWLAKLDRRKELAMAENTKIEWATHTFNPWMGCTKVSPACKNCYAERDTDKRFGTVQWGPNGTRVLTSDANWRKPLKWNKDAGKAGERHRVFCASLADVFEDWGGHVVDSKGEIVWNDSAGQTIDLQDVRNHLFKLIDATPHLDWLLLTKRPENVRRMWCSHVNTDGMPPSQLFRSNVWLGTSVENQEQADKRIPEILKCRDLSPVLFLSCEPLLGAVDLGLSSATCDCCYRWASRWINLPRDVHSELPAFVPDDNPRYAPKGVYRASSNKHGALSVEVNGGRLGVKPNEMEVLGPIDWVIAGGESGTDARPSHPDWFRSLRDQCQAAEVPFLFKQWGEWAPYSQLLYERCKHVDTHAFDEESSVFRVGKKAAGRLLDGREWNEFPTLDPLTPDPSPPNGRGENKSRK